MFKHATLAAIGLTAALSAAQADTIIATQGPHFGFAPHGTSSYNRLVEMCDAFGVDCSLPGTADVHVEIFSPEAQADADKRLALQLEEWEEFREEYEEYAELVPTPVLPRPHGLFGYQVPRPLPYPHPDLFGFEHRFHALPRPHVPNPFANPFERRFGNIPHTLIPHGTAPRYPLFPWPSL